MHTQISNVAISGKWNFKWLFFLPYAFLFVWIPTWVYFIGIVRNNSKANFIMKRKIKRKMTIFKRKLKHIVLTENTEFLKSKPMLSMFCFKRNVLLLEFFKKTDWKIIWQIEFGFSFLESFLLWIILLHQCRQKIRVWHPISQLLGMITKYFRIWLLPPSSLIFLHSPTSQAQRPTPTSPGSVELSLASGPLHKSLLSA